MSNIKKVLSMLLVVAMLLGMMLVPASAAEFKDADQITYTEEVAVTAGLGLFAIRNDDELLPVMSDLVGSTVSIQGFVKIYSDSFAFGGRNPEKGYRRTVLSGIVQGRTLIFT